MKKFEEGQLQTSTCMWNPMIISLQKLIPRGDKPSFKAREGGRSPPRPLEINPVKYRIDNLSHSSWNMVSHFTCRLYFHSPSARENMAALHVK